MPIKLNILVVENDIAVLSRVTSLLGKRGHNVIPVESREEAFTVLQKKKDSIDMALISLELPRLGAMPLIKTMRKAKHEIMLFVMSSDCGEEAIEAMHGGAYDCIRKTFTNARFWTKIDRAIERLSLKRELKKLKKERKSLYDPGTENMRAIFDSIADGIVVTDLDNNLIFCNSKAADMVDMPRDEILGKPVQELVKYKRLQKLLVSSPDAKSSFHSGHLEVCLLEVGDQRLRVHIDPVINRDGTHVGTVALVHDVMAITGMDSLKEDFIFMVSHELKAPLSAMLMQLSVVVDGLAGTLNKKQLSLLSKAKLKTKGMIALVSDLLDFQRIEEERILQQITQLNLTEILDRTIDLMTTMAEDKDITLKTHVIKDLPLIIGDKNGIEAIFVNLIGNAVKYTPDGGQVMVDIHKSGQDVRIKVVDTGIGIAQSDIKRIFEKFYRIKSESTSQIAGSGLGLSIVKRVVDLHKGSIHVHSEQDKGTTFIVTLPMAQ
ncbi:MAG: hypothetical protein BA865_12915 [Desulfobacterales bacterium S5133MH4]|nr:MAG: hypothetical protein BA865_12915 [Desulfobacterales bacterium S5133MH4]